MNPQDLKLVAFDFTVAAGAMSSPWWLDPMERGLHFYALAGGAILLTLRIAKAVRDWKYGPKGKE